MSTEIYLQNDSDEKKNRSVFSHSQSATRTFTSEKTSFAASDWMNDVFALISLGLILQRNRF